MTRMRGCRRIICLYLVFYFWTILSFGQVVTGTVTNREDGSPLSGAVVSLVNASGNLVDYCFTDKQGFFSTEISKDVDTLKVALFGYKEAVFRRPFQSEMAISLAINVLSIKESVIAAAKVEIKGDTLRYMVTALKRQEDLVLSDLLARIPGVEVNSQGFISYNGQQINRFYVDGKDVLGNSYYLVTQNLSANAIKDVEVLLHHQPVTMLRGIKESDKAALNIVLNEEAASKINWGISAGIGASPTPFAISASARLSGVYVGKAVSSTSIGGYDNQGYALRPQEKGVFSDRSYEHIDLQDKTGVQASQAPLSPKHSLFNETWEGATVNRMAVGENGTLGVSIKAERDVRQSLSNQTSRYLDTKHGLTLNRSEKDVNSISNYAGQLSYSENAKDFYFSDNLYADISAGNNSVETTGGLQRVQQTSSRRWDVENEAKISKVFNNRVFSLESFTQLSGLQERLVLQSGSIAGQDISSRLFVQQLKMSGLTHKKGAWQLSLSPEMQWMAFRRASNLEGLDADIPGLLAGINDIVYFNGGGLGSMNYKKAPWSGGMSFGVKYSRYQIDGKACGGVTAEASVFFKYVSGRWEASLHSVYKKSGPEIQSFGTPILLTGYYTLWTGQENIHFTPEWRTSSELLFREPVSGWNAHLASTVSLSETFLQGRQLYDGYILNYLVNEVTKVRRVYTSIAVSKGFFSINGNLNLSLYHNWTASAMRQNDIESPFQMHYFSPKASFTLPITRWWGLSAQMQGFFSFYLAEGYNTSGNYSGTLALNQTFRITDSLSAGCSGELFHNASVNTSMFFQDLFLVWNGVKGLRIRVEADNILNATEYTYRNVSPLLEETYSLNIRPFTILLGVDWRF